MLVLFPPGAIARGRVKGIRLDLVDNRWRESVFLLREIQRAIDPCPGLSTCIDRWRGIENGLRARRRMRWMQLEELDALGVGDLLY